VSQKGETDKDMLQESVIRVSKIKWSNWMGILYYKHFSRQFIYRFRMLAGN